MFRSVVSFIGDGIAYLIEGIGFLIVGYFIFAILRGIYFRISYLFKPYNRKVNELKRRKKVAIKSGSYKELQQVALEERWLDCHRLGRINQVVDNVAKTEVEDAAYVKLSATITKDDFVLPNVHNVASISFAFDFLDDILDRAEIAREASAYADTFYFPESVLPYPKDYLCFALSYHLDKYREAEEKNDSVFEFLIKNRIGNLRYFNKLLNVRAIDVSADLLSTEGTANKAYGDRFRGVE
jgi:hypothetical protein